MAEVLRALGPSEETAYMPLRELHEEQHREIYKAAGEQLVLLYELGEELSDGVFLVQLASGRQVSFPFGISDDVKTTN